MDGIGDVNFGFKFKGRRRNLCVGMSDWSAKSFTSTVDKNIVRRPYQHAAEVWSRNIYGERAGILSRSSRSALAKFRLSATIAIAFNQLRQCGEREAQGHACRQHGVTFKQPSSPF